MSQQECTHQCLRFLTPNTEGMGLVPVLGTKIPYATWCGQKEKKRMYSKFRSSSPSQTLIPSLGHKMYTDKGRMTNKKLKTLYILTAALGEHSHNHNQLSLIKWASLVAQTVKSLPAVWETQVQSLGWEDPLEKEMVTHSSILAWKIPWTEEPGELQPTRSQRVRHD